ncbi:MAG TPA: hypothetical protein VFK09_08675 [Gemmatimonadales bacterium]|jgi:hypothetical protein|nr:hypothetical protein [Gemmatimonadales bacterium]
MYASIRRYPILSGDARAALDEIRQPTQENFVPTLQQIPGFHGYFFVLGENDAVCTVTLFDTAEGAAESTRRAADFVRNTPFPVTLGQPEVLEGEVIVHREAGVPA